MISDQLTHELPFILLSGTSYYWYKFRKTHLRSVAAAKKDDVILCGVWSFLAIQLLAMVFTKLCHSFTYLAWMYIVAVSIEWGAGALVIKLLYHIFFGVLFYKVIFKVVASKAVRGILDLNKIRVGSVGIIEDIIFSSILSENYHINTVTMKNGSMIDVIFLKVDTSPSLKSEERVVIALPVSNHKEKFKIVHTDEELASAIMSISPITINLEDIYSIELSDVKLGY